MYKSTLEEYDYFLSCNVIIKWILVDWKTYLGKLLSVKKLFLSLHQYFKSQ